MDSCTSTIINEGNEQVGTVCAPDQNRNVDKEACSGKEISPGTEAVPISKSALKRLKKKQLWEQNKLERRKKEKERRKKRKLENPSQPSDKITRSQLKECKMSNSSCRVSIAIDLSLEKFMDERSLSKCIKQISRCYSINRRASNPVQFYVTSLEGKSLAEMSKNQGYDKWDVYFRNQHFMDIFDKDKIVYLTSESDNVIGDIEEDKVYIIGGLVDHNSHKGLCHKIAQEKGIKHGRLPISENIDLKTRKVLTIDHVFNIMVNVCNGKNWKDTLLQVLPPRKGAQEKHVPEPDSDSNNSNVDSAE
nr:EOG090X0D3U [Scapholeberis mucronata]